jgi:hypothetical protein
MLLCTVSDRQNVTLNTISKTHTVLINRYEITNAWYTFIHNYLSELHVPSLGIHTAAISPPK